MMYMAVSVPAQPNPIRGTSRTNIVAKLVRALLRPSSKCQNMKRPYKTQINTLCADFPRKSQEDQYTMSCWVLLVPTYLRLVSYCSKHSSALYMLGVRPSWYIDLLCRHRPSRHCQEHQALGALKKSSPQCWWAKSCPKPQITLCAQASKAKTPWFSWAAEELWLGTRRASCNIQPEWQIPSQKRPVPRFQANHQHKPYICHRPWTTQNWRQLKY